MGRLLCVFAACLFCAGAAGPHLFAGVGKATAAVQGTEVTRAFAPRLIYFQNEDPAVFKHLRLVEVVRSSDSAGREAWLTVFRYPGGHDAACVWVRRSDAGPAKYAFEETQSVAYGPAPERVHDRCARVAFRLRLLGPDDDAGSEMPVPGYAFPQPVSPFGPVARGSYLADLEYTDGASLTGLPARFPETTAPGTTAVEAFVIDERTAHVIPGATIEVRPSTRLSGFRRVPDGFRPVLTATADRHGSFALVNLPARSLGYDFLVTAPGYAPAYTVHDLSQPIVWIGDYSLARHTRFFDATIGPPPCGTGC